MQCNCSGCLSKDCGCCKFCLDMPRFGGPGKKKKRCIERACKGSQTEEVLVLSDATNASCVKSSPVSESQNKVHVMQQYTAEEIIKVLKLSMN